MQQVNLLNPQLLTPQVAFSSRTIGWMLVAVVGLGLAIYVWVMSGAQGVQSQMNQAQTELDALQARLDAFEQPGEDGLTEADKRGQALAAAKQNLEALRRVQTALGAVDGEAGFSAKLHALANEGVPGVWLTDIEFDATGFRLQGRALQPERIPEYLTVLSRQPTLSRLALSGFSIMPVESSDETGKAPLPGLAFAINPATSEGQP